MKEILISILMKLSSRKFLIAVGGIATGLILILNGNSEEGTASICTAVIGYLIAEGIIDAKALPKGVELEDESETEESVVGK